MSENILEMQNVTTCVNEGTSEEKEILKNISLNVKKGDFITLLGTNGAGKSTLLNFPQEAARSKLPETTSRNFQSSNAPASFRRSSRIPKQARHHE